MPYLNMSSKIFFYFNFFQKKPVQENFKQNCMLKDLKFAHNIFIYGREGMSRDHAITKFHQAAKKYLFRWSELFQKTRFSV